MLSLLVSVTGAQIGRSTVSLPAKIAAIGIEVFAFCECLLRLITQSSDAMMTGAASSRGR
jgi:hypothetical protein